MTLYTKPRSEVFASNAPESEIKPFTAWLRGLGIAFDETSGLPEMEGLNNVFNLLNQYIKYLEQNGFAEWSSDLEYPIGAGVRVGAVWYRAKTQNTNKNPATSQNDWELFLNASALTYENPLYIENNIVKVRSATQTQIGIVQFANPTEVANKSDVNKVINPSNASQISQSLAIGFGQTWQNVTSSRQASQIYTNTTGKPIQVNIKITGSTDIFSEASLYVGGVLVAATDPGNTGYTGMLNAIVPNNTSYSLTLGSRTSFTLWTELR